MSYTKPTITEFKTRFDRDFPYGNSMEEVRDADITNAFADVDVKLNEGLFDSQTAFAAAYLMLAAHFLVMNLRASSQGIAGQFDWLHSSKSAGGVSEGLSIPQRILDNPELAILSKTTYGARYLQMVLPQLSGQIFAVCGGTQA